MNIVSLVIRTRPEQRSSVECELLKLPGVEIAVSDPGGPCIVTVEDDDGRSAMDTITAIHKLPGVIAAGLAYHFSDLSGTKDPSDPIAHSTESAK